MVGSETPYLLVSIYCPAGRILVVSAEDKGTGSKEKITITNDQNLLTHEDEDEDEDKQC
jgi:heat shock protein 5